MGGFIKYTRTGFIEPDPIDEETYTLLKNRIMEDPYYRIVQNERLRDKFSRYIRMMYIGGIGLVISMLLSYILNLQKDGFLLFLSVPSGIILFGGFIYFFLESPSYAKYLEKSEAYFLRMKFAIQKSNSFFEFTEILYSIYSNDYDSDFKKWKRQYFRDSKKHKRT